MPYEIFINEKCEEEIKKICKKNRVLGKILRKKMDQIVENPYHFKPLKHELAGERRVHVQKSFVLRYEIDEKQRRVNFLFFGHHDVAYVK